MKSTGKRKMTMREWVEERQQVGVKELRRARADNPVKKEGCLLARDKGGVPPKYIYPQKMASIWMRLGTLCPSSENHPMQHALKRNACEFFFFFFFRMRTLQMGGR